MNDLSPYAQRCMRKVAGMEEIDCLDRMIYAARFSRPLLGHFVDVASRIYDVPAAVIMGRSRQDRIARSRGHAMYHAYVDGRGLSLPNIGHRMGGRDHTSVQHMIRRHAIRHGLYNPCPSSSPKTLERFGRYEGPEPTEANPWTPEMAVTGARR